MAVVAVPILTGCGDDEPDGGGELVGTWKSTGGMAGKLNIVQYIQFNSDGTYNEVDLDGGAVDEILYGRWTRKGNNIKISGGNTSMPIEAKITKLTDSRLVLKTIWEQTYVKVADYEINRYLQQ